METHAYRQARIGVEIPIIVTTVLDSFDAAIADLNQYGAQITGCTLAPATRFQIEYMGQTVYAQCRWSEVDRMGVKFFYPLVDGPLFERFMIAQASQIPSQAHSGTAMAYSQMQLRPGAGGGRAFGRAPQAAFGRRAG